MSPIAELTEVVVDLHSDLAEWLGTDAPPKVFDRFANALDDGFTSVVTTGEAVTRDALLSGVWSARNAQPGLEIEITDVTEIARTTKLVIVRFVAENRFGGASMRRRVTAVLLTDGQLYSWRSVHETAIPAAS
ncbi:hypothetical protein BJY24_000314 [Nocardia transvalensis]|uniref:DUF4440 domain-containing protein n=1 Tax=Nocardia transvalensis TaxID=37333 RepID=A0A7W9UFT3_9NOCA|nr:hypothetical protein [Nocardia transvalensis]MBB5911447.1 hypothetical protein [Nocardia transvalensis]